MGEANAAPWALPAARLFEELGASADGLSSPAAQQRLAEHGRNVVADAERVEWLDVLVSQFRSPLILLLVGAAAIAFWLGEYTDSLVIIAIVLLNSLLGFVQEYKAERALMDLRRLLVFRSKVLRDGTVVEIDSRDVVPGDVVYLDIGDMVPADIRLLSADELSMNESALTGESVPVLKDAGVAGQAALPQDIKNVAFMGTSVAGGCGHGIVISTGRDTFFGKTATYVSQKVPETDFQANMRKFSDFLLKVVFGITVFVFLVNALMGKRVIDSFMFALALAVGITPEMLPVIVTITLSSGALRLAKEQVITKKLVSVEDLGDMDVLCCDKTGTLTEGRLSLAGSVDADGRTDENVLLGGLLCNSASFSRAPDNPIDDAIWAGREELAPELARYKLLDQNEFDFERRRMGVAVSRGGRKKLIVKGASESVLGVSRHVLSGGRKKALTPRLRKELIGRVQAYERDGYSVIAVAERRLIGSLTQKSETNLTLLGFLLLIDPPKETVKEALELLRHLQVGIKVLSGDSPGITERTCRAIGLEMPGDRAVTGEELDMLGPAEFADVAEKSNVFALVTPEQKYKIVEALKREHVVGFLGDGVNDAPSLRLADVGISVDSASGIAKDSADMILGHKSLRVLAKGIREGRKTFSNITKYILNTVSANFGNMSTVALASVFLPFIPLTPSQILLNNFLSDVPLLTVSTDNVDAEMLHRPRKWNLGMISRAMVFFGAISTVFDLLTISFLLLVFAAPPAVFRTAWFLESTLSEVIVTFAIRTKKPFFRSKPSAWLVATSILAVGLAVAVVSASVGARLFGFAKMDAGVWMMVAGVLALYFAAVELLKFYFFSRESRR